MRRDGRTLDHRTLETIRTMAVARVQEGEQPSEVIASYGFHRCTIYRWLKAVRGRDQGFEALAARPATGRPRTLTAAQERQVFRWINGKNPRQYGFDFGLWTRQIVRDLIVQRFGVRLSLASIGPVLARQGLTPQKPLQRAYQRDPAAIVRWQHETYPAIVRTAKRDQAEIYFWDESGFRADAVQEQDLGAKGQTPLVSVPGQRQRISAASAISAKGRSGFATYAGGLTGERFVTFLRRLLRGRRKPLHLILDGLPAHKTKAVTQYVADLDGKLTLHYLPGYAPDLNPDELVWSYAKRTGNARRPLQKGEQLDERVSRQLAEIGRRPVLVRSFFKHPSVAYIADF
ncbi:MAG: IS630 family transposase [Nitrospira sp.]|nr:IS630 family transposase [Nitrospira sp.]